MSKNLRVVKDFPTPTSLLAHGRRWWRSQVIVVEDGGTVEEEASEVGGGEGDVAEGGYSCERV